MTPWARLRRVMLSICAGVGMLFLLATFTPFVSWYAKLLAGNWTDPRGDILIVLAGSDLADGFPSENTMLRCIYAVRAYREGGFRKIVVSGFQTSRHMRSLLAAEGVPAEIIVAEDAATTTRENALYTARVLSGDAGSKVLLTSEYHMFRAARAFRKAGLDVAPRPIPDALKRAGNPLKRWPAFLDEMAETVKAAGYLLRGWI